MISKNKVNHRHRSADRILIKESTPEAHKLDLWLDLRAKGLAIAVCSDPPVCRIRASKIPFVSCLLLSASEARNSEGAEGCSQTNHLIHSSELRIVARASGCVQHAPPYLRGSQKVVAVGVPDRIRLFQVRRLPERSLMPYIFLISHLPYMVLSVHHYVLRSDLNKRIYMRVRKCHASFLANSNLIKCDSMRSQAYILKQVSG